MPSTVNGVGTTYYGKSALKWGLPAAVAAVLAVVLGINHHIAGNQKLHLVNGLKFPASVSLDGGAEVSIAPRQRRELPLAEGRHRALVKVAGLPAETVEFEAGQGWFERFGDGTVFVLNLKGAAALLDEHAVYTPVGQPGVEGSLSLICGQSFVTLHDVDYVFRDLPEQISMAKDSRQVSKSRLGAELGEPTAVFLGLLGHVPESELLRYAEIHLDLDAPDAELVRGYLQVAAVFGQLPRCRAFLEKGLERRPLSIEWHRMYQAACEHTGKEGGLVARYDRMLAAEPESSALLYLRGRIEPRAARAIEFYDRSMAADPKNPYPRFAKAYHLLTRGEAAAAKPLALEACRLNPDDSQMETLLRNVRLGLGEYAELKADTLARQKKSPLDLSLALDLMEVCAASGDLKAAVAVHEAYCRRIFSRVGLVLPQGTKIGSPAPHLRLLAAKGDGKAAGETAGASWLALLYLQGDLEGLLRESKAFDAPADQARHAVQANLELARPADAEKAMTEAQREDASLALLMSVAWGRAGDAAKAAEWRGRAAKRLAAGRPDERRAAELLSKGEALDPAALDDLAMEAGQKAVVLAALADTCPARRAELLALARKLNVGMWFPHRFIEQVAGGKQ